MKSSIDLDHLAVRLNHSPAELNNRELRKGRRWTLLQAIAWIATGSEPFVDLVGSWTPLDEEYPHPGASRGASLELAKQLSFLLPPALRFPEAQIHLFRMLKSGQVVIYVAHTEHIPAGVDFFGFSYRSNYVGLLPPQDARSWEYIVVDTATLKAAWAADPASQRQMPTMSSRDHENDAVGAIRAVSAGPPFTRFSPWQVLQNWYEDRVQSAPSTGYTRKEDEAAARSVGIGRENWRALRKTCAPDHWGKSGSKKVGQKDN